MLRIVQTCVVVALAVAAAGCDVPRFSGRLGVIVESPAQTKVGLFPGPSNEGRLEEQVFVVVEQDRCRAVTDFEAAGAITPPLLFPAPDGPTEGAPFEIVLDQRVPANEWALIAWIDDDDDGELDFDPDPLERSEICVPAGRTFDGRELFLKQVDAFDDTGDGRDKFRARLEGFDELDDLNDDSDDIFLDDADANGWRFVL